MHAIADRSEFPGSAWPVLLSVAALIIIGHLALIVWLRGSQSVCDTQRAAGAHLNDCPHCRRRANARARGWWVW